MGPTLTPIQPVQSNNPFESLSMPGRDLSSAPATGLSALSSGGGLRTLADEYLHTLEQNEAFSKLSFSPEQYLALAAA